jgi:hypothetical protein
MERASVRVFCSVSLWPSIVVTEIKTERGFEVWWVLSTWGQSCHESSRVVLPRFASLVTNFKLALINKMSQKIVFVSK